MRSDLIFLLVLFLAACGGEGGSGSGTRAPSASPSDSLPPPEPGVLEDLRAAADPGSPAVGEEEAPREDLPPDTIPAVVRVAEPDTVVGVGRAETSEDAVAPAEGERPLYVRGVYLNAWTAGSPTRRGRLVEMARRTEINTFVIDIKDATGYVSHDSRVPLAREVGATGEVRIRDLPGVLEELRKAGIYPIARIVVAKDPLLARGRPDLAIQDTAGGPWEDQHGVRWLNFHHPEVWAYHLDLAREVVEAGFPEVQWDYVRFPDAPESFLSRTVYPGGEGRSKTEAVRAFLGHTRKVLGEMGAVLTADVFGVTTSYRRDVGIGQLWESFIDRVDVALPMVYPSHYWTGSFGFQEPNAHPYEIVRRALRDARRRSALVEGAGLTRPWLQDFSLGEPPYGAPEVRAQIQATYDAGIQEWILWNPGSRYTESALIPARGLPVWLEPVMRVGGEVVPISRRFQVLGEDPAPGGEDALLAEVADPGPARVEVSPDVQTLPTVPVPDTSAPRPSGGAPSQPRTPRGPGPGANLSLRRPPPVAPECGRTPLFELGV